ncbi:MAG: hypothetical protein CMM91_10340 [Rickettsiales bacterium]|nr:hypothetical protein [Rickettsiales bacterium]OUV52873.1 MAG: hypothetical protein CBC87_05825 [Rickettsiales bacterium TMED127]|tara:strand:+ start:14235 stop:14759 length:525 start_codon:yes stop_codon:yes gene_type:complete
MKNFRNINILFVFLFVITPFSSDSHGPSRQKVIKEIELNATIDDVWKVISNFKDMSWHPDVAKVDSEGDGIGTKRIIQFKNGKNIIQSLEKIDAEKKKITWRITKTDLDIMPVNSYSANIFLNSNKGKTNLKYKVAFYRGFMGNDPPEDLNDENSKKKVNEFIEKGLDGLKSKF